MSSIAITRTLAPWPRPLALERLVAGQVVIVGGDRYVTVGDELAAAFAAGDRLIALGDTGDLLHVPAAQHAHRRRGVGDAADGVRRAGAVSDEQISSFFEAFAARLADDDVFGRRRSRPTAPTSRPPSGRGGRRPGWCSPTHARRHDRRAAGVARLAVAAATPRSATIDHDGWPVEARRAPLGVVGFVFEGRPNVFADAAGVVRTGNTVVMRIGVRRAGHRRGDRRARVAPALAAAGLPAGTIVLVRSQAAGGRLGAVRPAAAGARRRPRLGSGGGPARRRRPPVRHPGQPPRHRRGVDGRRRRRPTPAGSPRA